MAAAGPKCPSRRDRQARPTRSCVRPTRALWRHSADTIADLRRLYLRAAVAAKRLLESVRSRVRGRCASEAQAAVLTISHWRSLGVRLDRDAASRSSAERRSKARWRCAASRSPAPIRTLRASMCRARTHDDRPPRPGRSPGASAGCPGTFGTQCGGEPQGRLPDGQELSPFEQPRKGAFPDEDIARPTRSAREV